MILFYFVDVIACVEAADTLVKQQQTSSDQETVSQLDLSYFILIESALWILCLLCPFGFLFYIDFNMKRVRNGVLSLLYV